MFKVGDIVRAAFDANTYEILGMDQYGYIIQCRSSRIIYAGVDGRQLTFIRIGSSTQAQGQSQYNQDPWNQQLPQGQQLHAGQAAIPGGLSQFAQGLRNGEFQIPPQAIIPPVSKKCECGCSAIGVANHSDYCPLYEKSTT